MLGLLAGAGLGLLAEITDLSFHDARSLQSRLGIPVLAAVPPVVLESDRLFARARRVRQAIGVAAVTSAVLVASLAGQLDRERAARAAGPPDERRRARARRGTAVTRAGASERRAVGEGAACTTSTTGSFGAPSR